jgi:hypothetical protein
MSSEERKIARTETRRAEKKKKNCKCTSFLFWRNRSGMKIMRRRRAELHLSHTHVCKVAGRVGWRKKVLSCARLHQKLSHYCRQHMSCETL